MTGLYGAGIVSAMSEILCYIAAYCRTSAFSSTGIMMMNKRPRTEMHAMQPTAAHS